MTERFVCSSCGDTATHPLASRPAVDERYAVGWCDVCDPPTTLDELNKRRAKTNHSREKAGKDPLPPVTFVPDRKVYALVREDRWDPKVREERLAAEHRQFILGKLRRGAPMTPTELAEARSLRDSLFGDRP